MATDSYHDHNYGSSSQLIEPMTQTDISEEIESPSTSNTSWQTVTTRNNKRNLKPEEISLSRQESKRHRVTNEGKKQATDVPITLKNTFEPLASSLDGSMDHETLAPGTGESKPPPIFLSGVTNVAPMIEALDSMVTRSGYSYKCLNQDNIKVFPSSSNDYRKIVKGLTDLNATFHTYQLKQERAYRVVLRDMHYSVSVEDLKSAIEDSGHQVRHLTNVRNKYTKKPMSLFFIDLEPKANNKDIFQIKYLLNAKVSFEPPNKKKEIVQCKRCQRYGHTKSYCHNAFRCVKCSQEHDTRVCPKPSTAPPTCVLCFGEHPASYKGCPVYREMQSKQFPPLREKSLKVSHDNKLAVPQSASGDNPNHQRCKISSVKEGVTFAQATRKTNEATHTSQLKPNEQCQDSDNLSDIILKSFERFETILSKQAEQISSLLNLLTTVVARLK